MDNPLERIRSYLAKRKTFPEPLRDFLAPVPYSPIFLNRHYILEAVEKSVQFLVPGRFIDIGCGMKPYEEIFKPLASEYIGIDHPETKKGSYGALTKADVFSDSEDLPFADGSFDSAICTQVLEHIDHPGHKISEISRILRPGGTVLFTVPFAWPLHEVPYDFFRYTEFGLKALLEKADLEVIFAEPQGNAIEALAQIAIELYIAKAGVKGIRKYGMYSGSLFLSLTAIVLGNILPSKEFVMGLTMIGKKRIA